MKEQFAEEETNYKAGWGTRIWVLLLAGILGASFACFACSLITERFAAFFYTSLATGGTVGIALAAVILLFTGKMKTLSQGLVSKTAVILGMFAVFFSAAVMLTVAGKDMKAPIIAFSDEMITMHQGDPETVLFTNMVVSDNKDGNLRDQLEVVSFVYSEDGKTADVMYAATDSSGNRATASQMIYVEGQPWPTE